MRLQGRTAIVTGGGSGIGQASAMLFAQEGAFVALVDRDEAGLKETLAALPNANKASMHVGDVGDGDFALAVVGEIVARRGQLDVLMTSAGFSCGGTVVTTARCRRHWCEIRRPNPRALWSPRCRRRKSRPRSSTRRADRAARRSLRPRSAQNRRHRHRRDASTPCLHWGVPPVFPSDRPRHDPPARRTRLPARTAWHWPDRCRSPRR